MPPKRTISALITMRLYVYSLFLLTGEILDVKKRDKKLDITRVNDHDKWMYFGDTLSKGKKIIMCFTTHVCLT